MEEQEKFRETKSALLEDLVRRRWVYENGTLLNIQEARRGVLSGEITLKGIEKGLNFRGFYESTRNGPRLTIPNLPAFIVDPIIDLSSISSEDALQLDREGPQIELQGTFGIGDEITLQTLVSFTQLSRRGRSRSHNPSNNTRGSDFSPSFSESSLGPTSLKHRPRCFSKDMIIQQAPSRTITWTAVDEFSRASPFSSLTPSSSASSLVASAVAVDDLGLEAFAAATSSSTEVQS